jgi:hypothetical protein
MRKGEFNRQIAVKKIPETTAIAGCTSSTGPLECVPTGCREAAAAFNQASQAKVLDRSGIYLKTGLANAGHEDYALRSFGKTKRRRAVCS